jgi:hypothetical protein
VRRLLIALLGALVLQLGLLQAAEAQDATTTTTTSTTTAPTTTVAPTTTAAPSTTTPGPEFGVFDRQPASGPVRTVIAVNPVTPCVPPQGAPNPEVDVLLFNQRDIDQNTDPTAAEVFAVGADGTWSGKLTVPADAELGKYFLAAACFAGAEEEEPFLVYEEQQFTVTAASGAPPAVAVPGTPTVTG